MRLLYLTTSMQEDDFAFLLKESKKKPNPSNQNFHEKMISSLSGNDIEVISSVPVIFNKRFLDSGYYHYINCSSLLEKALFRRDGEIIDKAKNIYKGRDKPDFIIFDSLSLPCAKASKKLSSLWGCRSIAILTDNPENLSSAPTKYIDKVFELSSSASGALSLTKKLLAVFGLEDKPNLIIPGLAENPIESDKGDYIYFGGALYERYGVADLIEGFLAKDRKIELKIAGHGPLEDTIRALSQNHHNLTFLGQISKKENRKMEAGAKLLVNPRIFDENLDRESIPSKMFEYMSLGDCVASTKNSFFEEEFGDSINWCDGDWGKFFDEHIDENGGMTNLIPNKSKDEIQAKYGITEIGNKINKFLSDFPD